MRSDRVGPLRRLLPAALLLVATGTRAARAHGTMHEVLSEGCLCVRAQFDTGEPIAHAAVLIFAPGESEVSRRTTTDSGGVFHLMPDRPGTWIMQVRDKAGHGMRINLDVDSSMAASPDARGGARSTTTLQKAVMAVCVIWGFAGTALFFGSRARMPSDHA